MLHLITTSPHALNPNLIPIQPPASRAVSRTAQRELDEVAAHILPAGRSHLASILTGSGHTALGMDVIVLSRILLGCHCGLYGFYPLGCLSVPTDV